MDLAALDPGSSPRLKVRPEDFGGMSCRPSDKKQLPLLGGISASFDEGEVPIEDGVYVDERSTPLNQIAGFDGRPVDDFWPIG